MLLFVTESVTSADDTRLRAINQYGLGDLPHDPALDDIARLAAEVCRNPAAAVAIVKQNEIALIGKHGLGVGTLPLEALPCSVTIEADGIYQVPDTLQSTAYATTGFVIEGMRYRSFAGAPVQTPAGVAIGCLFLLDTVPHRLEEAQLENLEALSHMVTTRLELIMRVRETHRVSRAHQRSEAALTVEKNFVAAVLDTVGALVVVFDTAGRIVRFNRACESISGYRSTDLVGTFVWEKLIPKEDVPEYIQGFERIRQGRFPTAFENYWLARDGSRRRIAWSATALLDSRGQVAFIIATGIDVTVQRVAEKAIRESEARYREIVEGSLGLVCTHDLQGRMLSINQHGAQSFGREIDDVVGHRLAEFIYPERHSLLQVYLESLMRTGQAQGSMHLRHTNGEERVLAYRNRLVRPAEGEPYVLGFAVDITDQVRAEDQLRALIRQSNSVLESVGDGIYGIDLEGKVTVVNSAAAQMLGYTPEEMMGRQMHPLIQASREDGSPYPEAESPIQGTLQELVPVRVSNEVFWRRDGSSFPVEYVAQPQIEIPDLLPGQLESERRGRAVGVVVAFTDISERNALDRMKDEFISTVSHELRTPLTSLRAALGLLAGGALDERPERSRQMMDIAIGSTDRLVRLVNDILDLERINSGKAEMHFVTCSVEDLFRRATALLQNQATRNNVRFTLESNGVAVWADPERIVQTLIHLLSNAMRFSASEGGDEVDIRLSARYVTPLEASLTVQDFGVGIPEDKLQVIFERFQQVDASDSRSMGGTGLGLAICRGILTQHGGEIWATSTVGKGSTFHITLPTQPRRRLR